MYMFQLSTLDVLNNVTNCSSEEYLFLGGGSNLTNAVLDRNHQEPHAASRSCLKKLVEMYDLCDIWRYIGCVTQ